MKKIMLVVFVLAIILTSMVNAVAEEEIVYEYAFERGNSEYQMYYVFDTDDMIVRYFSTNDNGVMVGTFSGDADTGFSIHWMEGWDETFQILSETKAVLIDYSGFDYDYTPVPVEDAVAILNQGNYYDMELE